MKYICNAAKEGRCKAEVGKCNHRGQHYAWHMCKLDVPCTEERFCEIQQEMVRCVEVGLFPNKKNPIVEVELLPNMKNPVVEVELLPNMKNPVMVSDELAREFVEWERIFICNRPDSHVCGRLATCFKEQLK